MNNLNQRARNAMTGLAIGDAISWTAMFHRSFLLPPWTRRMRREIDASAETTNVIVTPMPFSLNRPASHFNISPTDNTEWAAFTADILLNSDVNSCQQNLMDAWLKLAESTEPVRGSVATQAALHNLRNGIMPPQSGKENPHYFDDGALPRAVPVGILCAGNPERAASLAELDASITNSEDGVWAAQAMAVAISLVCAGEKVENAISRASTYLPESSWIRRVVDEASKIAEQGGSVFSLLPLLQNNIVNREYSYGNIATETLALTFVIARLHGSNFETAVMAASGFAKSGETLPSMVGALTGAQQTNEIVGDAWLKAITSLKGISIPSFAGKNYITLTEQLANSAGEKI